MSKSCASHKTPALGEKNFNGSAVNWDNSCRDLLSRKGIQDCFLEYPSI